MSVKEAHPSELDWSKLLAGELGWSAARRLRRHQESCPACRQLAAEMAVERTSFDASPQRAGELALLQGRLAASRLAPRAAPRLRWVFAAGVAAAVVAAIGVRTAPPRSELVGKGRDAFTVYVARPSGPVPLGSRCAPGDRVIARYRTERHYLLVLERDGRGHVQTLLPQDGAASARLATAEGTTPTSWVLDDVPGRECFAAFFSDERLDAALARQALADSADSPTLPGAAIRLHCCEKERAR